MKIENALLPVAQVAPHSPQRKRFNLRMKSFSLDSPESPSVTGVAGYPNSQTTGHNSGQNLADMMLVGQPARQDYEQQQQQPASYSGQLYLAQTAAVGGQSGYQQQQQQHKSQPGGYLQSNDTAAGYRSQQQYGGESSVAADSQQLNSYLSATRQPGGTNQQYYQHRHSFHNPSFHYPAQQQQQHDDRLESSNQHSSSHSALNSIHLNPLEQVRRVGVGQAGEAHKRSSTDNISSTTSTNAPNDCKFIIIIIIYIHTPASSFRDLLRSSETKLERKRRDSFVFTQKSMRYKSNNHACRPRSLFVYVHVAS